MNFWPRYIGDIQRKTGHLSCAEMGAYDRLLDHMYATEGPLPGDIDAICRIARAMNKSERAAIESVLREFFVLGADGYTNPRVTQEITRAIPKLEAARANGKLGGRPSGTQQKPSGFPAGTHEEPTSKAPQNQIPPSEVLGEGSPKPPLRANAPRGKQMSLSDLIAAGVPKQAAEDWLTVRRTKRAPLTPTAWDGICSEATKAGITPVEAVKFSASMSWQGFKASWYAAEIARGNGHTPTARPTKADKHAAFMADLTGRKPNGPDEIVDVEARVVG